MAFKNEGKLSGITGESMYFNFKSQSEPWYKCWYRWQKNLDIPPMKKVMIDFQNGSLLLENMFEYLIISQTAEVQINLVHSVWRENWRQLTELIKLISEWSV